MKLDWRPVSLLRRDGELGPAISTSVTLNETAELIKMAAGKRVLEIGSAYGYSAIAMALHGAEVYAMDPHSWIAGSYESMKSNIHAYGVVDNVIIKVTDSYTELPQLISSGEKFDLVWIDGDHELPAVNHDVGLGRLLIKEDGYLACHDYGEATCPGVRLSLDQWNPPPRLVDTLAIYGPSQW